MRLHLLPFAIVLVLSACGKTGDLYLPDDKAEETASPKIEAPITETLGEL